MKSFLRQTLAGLAVALLPTVAQTQELNMVVGTYTDGTSRGLYSFRFNQESGESVPLDTLDLSNPSFLTFSPDGSRIYAVSENDSPDDSVNAISFDKATGKMRWMNSQPVYGAAPCFVETNGRLLLTANYTGGSMSVLPLAADGRILPISQLILGTTAPGNMPQQAKPHVHCSRFSPDGKSILATDFSANRLMRLSLKSNGKTGNPKTAAELLPNSGCRHFVWSKDQRYLYVISELGGTVSVFRNGKGKMRRLQVVACDTVGAHGSADIHLTPDGRFLYASNRLKADGLAIFAVNPETGLLTRKGYQLTGLHPRNFAITPNGRFLLCACRDSNVIQVFRIDPQTGLLTDTHHDIRLSKPVCVKFHKT